MGTQQGMFVLNDGPKGTNCLPCGDVGTSPADNMLIQTSFATTTRPISTQGVPMSINLNGRIIADTRVTGISGARLAGGHLLKLSLEFAALGWDLPDPPVVVFAPAQVVLTRPHGLHLGLAFPEVVQPFRVTSYGGATHAGFDLFMSQAAMEAIEQLRDGGGVILSISLRGELRQTKEVHRLYDDIHATLNVVQWHAALEQCGFGRSMLFEVPIPSSPGAAGAAVELLEVARQHFQSGHYPDAVSKCRMVLERLTAELGQDALLKAANDTKKIDRTREQREFAMRQAAMDFASLAHHPTGVPQHELFDRNAAQMMLGTTAALVSSALKRV